MLRQWPTFISTLEGVMSPREKQDAKMSLMFHECMLVCVDIRLYLHASSQLEYILGHSENRSDSENQCTESLRGLYIRICMLSLT